MRDSKFSLNDKVTYFGKLVGRVVLIKADGWVEVEDGNGRIDEYPAEHLQRA